MAFCKVTLLKSFLNCNGRVHSSKLQEMPFILDAQGIPGILEKEYLEKEQLGKERLEKEHLELNCLELDFLEKNEGYHLD